MSIQLQVGNDVFNFPQQGETAPWGEDVTAWAEAVTDALTTVQGPNDILITQAPLANNQTTLANIAGLTFNTGQVQAINVPFLVKRTYDSGSTVVTESGAIIGNYNGTEFVISIDSVGDSGIEFDITNGGQIQYKTSSLANHIESVIYFKATTIDT